MNQPLAVSQAEALLTTLLSQHGRADAISAHHYHDLLKEADKYVQADKAAHMSPDLAPYSLLGMQLAGLHQGNLLSAELYPELRQAELDTLDWLKQCFGLPYAHFSHGGSENNLQALWQARDRHDGTRQTVFASRARHYSVDKACQLLGLKLQLIATDSQDRMDLTALEAACRKQAPLAIIMTAGTTAAGAMDPLQLASAIAEQYQSWLHIDAAWGGALLMLPEQSALVASLNKADSLCLDPHKSLFQPRPSSVYLSQHALVPGSRTDYLDNAPGERLTGSYGAELFLPLWLNLKILGEAWFFQQTRARLHQARRFSALLKQQNMKVWNGGTGIVCFAAMDNEFDELVRNGTLSRASINQQAVYRTVFAGSRTKAEAVFRALHLSR
ncbi:aminotransferase class V-fold PLP-dependent enzyme [Methylophaga sp.]|uniref:pyridoxal phosphate-dependent decarboxylase family protein n=1 Tax=Methylophaga sp. TaxID=2024840 RepID=UPI0014005CF7|nr:aminotransferase class V-fold PLP-dependent enzyme [Methylophaga sp.]MTI62809.1 aspartate aminotransferase family protein [Methylophaga sp.]